MSIFPTRTKKQEWEEEKEEKNEEEEKGWGQENKKLKLVKFIYNLH